MTQQGPPPPEPGRTPGGRSRRPPWQNGDQDDEDYAAWVGQSILPRYADQEERDRRRLGDPRERSRDEAGGQPGRFGKRGRTPERGIPGEAGPDRAERDAGLARPADGRPAEEARRAAESGRRAPADGAEEGGWRNDARHAGARRAEDLGRPGDSGRAEKARRAGDAGRPEKARSDDSGWAQEVASFAGGRRGQGDGRGRRSASDSQAGGRGRRDDAVWEEDGAGRSEEMGGFGGSPRPGTRSAAGRIRRGRRTIWTRATALVAVIVIAVASWLLLTRKPASKPVSNGLVTSFLPGEFKSVPNACSAVSAATLGSYVPGKRRTLVPRSLFGSQASSCVWSVDAHPVYRFLQVNLRAYAPNGLAEGNGSATDAAIGAYRKAQAQQARPPKGQRPARVALLPALGQTAFSAAQSPSAGGVKTDMVTVVARERNVLVTVVYEGLVTRNGRYGPVSMANLQDGADSVAREVLARLG